MLQSNNRILTLSGFNAVLFIQNAAQVENSSVVQLWHNLGVKLGDIIKRMQGDVCQPDELLLAAIILIPLSLVLQFCHVIAMLVYQKPDDDLPEQQRVDQTRSYRKKLVYENVLAAFVILLNILISYTIVEQIRDYDHENCSFWCMYSKLHNWKGFYLKKISAVYKNTVCISHQSNILLSVKCVYSIPWLLLLLLLLLRRIIEAILQGHWDVTMLILKDTLHWWWNRR